MPSCEFKKDAIIIKRCQGSIQLITSFLRTKAQCAKPIFQKIVSEMNTIYLLQTVAIFPMSEKVMIVSVT